MLLTYSYKKIPSQELLHESFKGVSQFILNDLFFLFFIKKDWFIVQIDEQFDIELENKKSNESDPEFKKERQKTKASLQVIPFPILRACLHGAGGPQGGGETRLSI